MSKTLERVIYLIQNGEVLISLHGYNELAADNIRVNEVITAVSLAIVVEDYPEYYKGPAVLVLQHDDEGLPIHVVWGIPKGASSPAVLITAYRPDRGRWSSDYLRRKS